MDESHWCGTGGGTGGGTDAPASSREALHRKAVWESRGWKRPPPPENPLVALGPPLQVCLQRGGQLPQVRAPWWVAWPPLGRTGRGTVPRRGARTAAAPGRCGMGWLRFVYQHRPSLVPCLSVLLRRPPSLPSPETCWFLIVRRLRERGAGCTSWHLNVTCSLRQALALSSL